MNTSIPHYLLLSESHPANGSDAKASTDALVGRWRIILEAVDGSSRLEAFDDEDLPPERLELLAVIRGLEAIPQPARVTLTTDSAYVRHGLRFGLKEWRQNGWQWERFGQWSSVANADLWQRLDRALGIHQVQCHARRFDQAHPASESSESTRGRNSGIGCVDSPSESFCSKTLCDSFLGRGMFRNRLGHLLSQLASGLLGKLHRSRDRARTLCAS